LQYSSYNGILEKIAFFIFAMSSAAKGTNAAKGRYYEEKVHKRSNCRGEELVFKN